MGRLGQLRVQAELQAREEVEKGKKTRRAQLQRQTLQVL
jgi:hypothetical protein